MSQNYIYIVAKWKVKSDYLETVLQELDELAKSSQAESGNISYKIHQSINEPNVIIIYEIYQDGAAVEAHKNSAHYKSIVAEKIIPLLEDREVNILKSII